MFSILNHKSPGPDGFSSGFFKTTWHTTGPMVYATVRNFLNSGQMPLFLSATKLILLPKVAYPRSTIDFRPISCCNVLYKVISKLLSERIKEVLPCLINQCQGAFVKGRDIIHNVLICQDITRGYQRRNISPRCPLKVDLKKAFDFVHWDFLEELLEALHFPINGLWHVFVTLNSSCTSMVAFTGASWGVVGFAKVTPCHPFCLCL